MNVSLVLYHCQRAKATYHSLAAKTRGILANLSAEDMLKSAVIEEKKFKNIESEWFGPRSMNDLDLWYS